MSDYIPENILEDTAKTTETAVMDEFTPGEEVNLVGKNAFGGGKSFDDTARKKIIEERLKKSSKDKIIRCPYCFEIISSPVYIGGNYKCPKCDGKLPSNYGKYPVKFLSVIGASGSGKTVYLSNLLKFSDKAENNPLIKYRYTVGDCIYGEDEKSSFMNKVTQIARVWNEEEGWTTVPSDLDTSSEEEMEKIKKSLKEKENKNVGNIVPEGELIKEGDFVIVNYPKATATKDKLIPLIVELDYNMATKFTSTRHLVLFDIAGENLGNREAIKTCKHLFYSDGLLCLVSPDDIKEKLSESIEFRHASPVNGEEVSEDAPCILNGRNTKVNVIDVLDNFQRVFRGIKTDSGKSGMDVFEKIPLAVVLTKSDMYLNARVTKTTGGYKTIGEFDEIFKQIKYPDDNNSYLKSAEADIEETVEALFPYKSSEVFEIIMQWYRAYKAFAVSSFPSIKKIDFVAREKVKTLVSGADGVKTEYIEKDIFKVLDKTLEDEDFKPLRIEEPIGWMFYEWGWLGSDAEVIKTKLLKWKILFGEKGYSLSEKIKYWFKILLNKDY